MTATDDRPLRIVSVLTTHVAGGAEYAAVDMLAALARGGADVELLTNRPSLVQGTAVPATAIDLGPKLRRRTLLTTTVRAPVTRHALIRALRAAAAGGPIDVLLLHYKKEQLLGVALPRSLAAATVWAEWGPLPAPLRGGLPGRVYAAASRSARLVIAESEGTAASLRAAGVADERIAIVPNVLDDGGLAFDATARSEMRREWRLADDAFVLGCITRLDPAKRVDVLVDALRVLDERIVLVLAGEGGGEADLRRLAAPYGKRVRFVGGARGRVAELLSACDVQVYAPGPSEGAARAVTFGQLVGRPVIATAPEGAHGLVAPGTGTIVDPPHSPAAVAAVLAAYAQDPERVAAEGAAGRRLVLERIARSGALPALESALRSAARAG